MANMIRGTVCAVLVGILVQASPVAAAEKELLKVRIPVGGGGTITAPGTAAAEKEIRKIPGGADVVPAKAFQNGYALSMKDMLATTPGVTAQPRWGEESRLSIRGSGLSRSFHLRGITLLQDGIPFNFADGSGDFQEVDPLVLQHIEIYRGGQGLRYGAASLGGAVNMVTPTAHTAGYEGLLRAEGGSYKTMRLHGEAAKVFNGADIFASVTKSVSNGYRQQSEQNNQRFFGNAGVKLGDKAETRFYVAWNDINQEVPGTISKKDALKNPRTTPAINVTNRYARDINSLRIANRTAVKFDNGMEAEAGVYANNKALYHPIFQVVDQKSLDAGIFARLKGRYDAGGLKTDFTIGINTGRGVNDAKRFLNVIGKRGAIQADGKQVAENIELYGENRLHLNRAWSLISGVQGTIANREYTDNRNNANNDEKIFRSLNPKLGVMWEPDADTQIFASITRSSEVPTFSELVQGAGVNFIPVKLQKAWTAEIGSRGRRGDFSWDATLYHAQVRDELLNYTVAASIPASTFNADKTIHQGIELGAGWQVTDELSFAAVYTLNDFKFDGDAQFRDNDLAGAPKHQVRLSARYEKKGFYIEPNIELVPQAAYVDYANTLKANSYVLPGVKAGYEMNGNISFFVDARNLTDEENIGSFTTITDARTAGTNVFYPGEGSSVFGGVKIKF